MAQVQPAVNRFITDISKLERKLQKDLRSVVRNMSRLSDTQLINAIGQLNLFNEIIEQGYGDALNGLDKEYETLLTKAIGEATKRGVTPLSGAGLQGLETLRELNTAELLGRARVHSNRLTSAIFQNLYAGVSVNDTIKVLEGIPLAGFQLETLTYTGIKTFDDAARYKVFEGLGVKWTYFGPLDDRTRDSCRKTKEKEPEGGYTEKQALNSETPFGIRGGFNCRHSWEVR